MTEVSPVSRSRILTGTAVGLFDACGNHVLDDGPITAIIPGAPATVLADSQRIYFVSGDRSVLRAAVPAGSAATCLVRQNDSVFVGGDGAQLWKLCDSVLVEISSFALAPTRADWHTPWGGPPSVMSMAADDDNLFVNIHVGGILRSTDRGESWQPTIDIGADVHDIALGRDEQVWAATGAAGLAESRDRGTTWRYHVDGLHGTYLTAVVVVGDEVMIAASTDYRCTDTALYRFDGRSFERCGVGPVASLTAGVGSQQLAASDAVVVANTSTGVATSDNVGRTWTLLDETSTLSEVVAVLEQ